MVSLRAPETLLWPLPLQEKLVTPVGSESQLGLLLAVSEREMTAWQSAAREGAVLAIG